MFARISTLALGAFAVGTSGYIVTGVLPELSAELSVPVSTAGQLTTVFALTYAIGSPVLATVTGGWGRRGVLVAALLVTAVGNAFVAVAPGFTSVLAARIVTAAGAALFTPAATAVAAQLSGPERRARAAALVFGGLTVATIVGVPAGSVLAGPLGYQGVFWFVAAFAAVSALAVALAVPVVRAPSRVTLRQRFAAARDARVLALLSIVLLASLGVFTVYTYVAPVLASTAGVHGSVLGLLLFGYGVGGAIGNVVGGFAADRYGFRMPLLCSVLVTVLALAVLPLAGGAVAAAGVLFAWGLSTWAFNPPIQRRLIELSPGLSGLLLALNASALYLGIGLSGLVGAAVIDGVGVRALPPVGCLLCLAAFIVHVVTSRRRNTLMA